MTPPRITTIQQLHAYLRVAMQLEHATIPPYLTALYSIRPLTNLDATQVLRVIAVEEMLHLTLAANILNAVGGRPDLTVQGFVPTYPAFLPDGETDFKVDLQPFSVGAVQTFLRIERPRQAPDENCRCARVHRRAHLTFGTVPDEPTMSFYSIGEFYQEIIRGLQYLDKIPGLTLFSPTPRNQVTSEYYYSGGGKLFPVTDLDSAVEAARLIIEQGEGLGGRITKDELAHVFRFQELVLGNFYQPGDRPGEPSGPPVNVDWTAVYPIKRNARMADYPAGSELYKAAYEFNVDYLRFLCLLTRAFNGKPDLLETEAVPFMFRLRNRMIQLIQNPIPGMEGMNAAPTFEVDLVREAVKPCSFGEE